MKTYSEWVDNQNDRIKNTLHLRFTEREMEMIDSMREYEMLLAKAMQWVYASPIDNSNKLRMIQDYESFFSIKP